MAVETVREERLWVVREGAARYEQFSGSRIGSKGPNPVASAT